MAPSLIATVLGVTSFFVSLTVAQLSGSLVFDYQETIQVTIENDSNSNLTIPGTNNLFDRQNLMAYAPITITNLTKSPVTLNGTRYAAPPLSDDVFQDLPPGGSYVRNLNVSQYILGGTSDGLGLNVMSECFIASLPSYVYALNVTGITSEQDVATYYLSKGLQAVTIKSVPLHFNYTVPLDFTPDQAAAIKNDANVRRLAEQKPGSVSVETRGRPRRRFQ